MTKPKLPDGTALETCFRAIEAAAIAGERCPDNTVQGVQSHYVKRLADQGRVRVLIYRHNFRVVEILAGPHAGKSTKPPSEPGPPYRIVDINGTHYRSKGRLSKVMPEGGRADPSKGSRMSQVAMTGNRRLPSPPQPYNPELINRLLER